MRTSESFVLPFKWRGFGRWYRETVAISSDNENGKLRIVSTEFVASNRKLNGIRITCEIQSYRRSPFKLLLCAMLADLEHEELLEPLVGNPDNFAARAVQPVEFICEPGETRTCELFIPEEGWILPSIWRFLMHSLGLHHKTDERLPEIIVFAFATDNKRPLLSTTKAFDYYGSAHRLQENLILDEFYDILHLEPFASESDIQKAYIATCRKFQAFLEDCASSAVLRMRSKMFSRMKQGYHIWTERLNKRRGID